MQRRRESLTGLRILVAEDETFVLMDIEDMLHDLQGEIVGPVSTVEAAIAAIRERPVGGALRGLNRHGRTSLPAAAEPMRRAVRVRPVSGYASRNGDVPALRDAPRLTKPFSLGDPRAAMHEVFIQRA